MHYNISDINKILDIVLGDEATGIYINSDSVPDDNIVIDYPIYTNLSTRTTIDYWEDYEDFKFDCGATKLIIIPKNKDYVIKIPFTGLYTFETDDNVEDNEKDIISVNYNQMDICEREIDIYKKASGLLKKIIAPNIYVGTYKNIPIYIQKKIKKNFVDSYFGHLYEDDYFSRYSSFNRKKIIEKISEDSDYYLNRVYVDLIMKTYGIKNTLNMLKEMNTCIEDLHEFNYGFDFNGNCVLFDIGGYSEDLWG